MMREGVLGAGGALNPPPAPAPPPPFAARDYPHPGIGLGLPPLAPPFPNEGGASVPFLSDTPFEFLTYQLALAG